MRLISLLLASICLCSCWNWDANGYYAPTVPRTQKVWGNKPVYKAKAEAKVIRYIAEKQPLLQAGNIYAFGQYIFQVDVGSGIHVIDNSDPATADRVGFIEMTGCAQISIRGHYLYTNSLDDLVTVDISDPTHLVEVNRVPRAFPEMGFNSPLAQPEERGYYECPVYDSVVVGWVKDSIYVSCYKN